MPLPSFIIHLFGPLRVLVHGEPLPRLRTRTVEWLLALLVLRHGRDIDRLWLAGTLWPDSDERQALRNLRNALVHLRKALGSEANRIQSPSRDTLTIDLDDAEVDLITFDQAIKTGTEEALRIAVSVYTGSLLEGCYEEWVTLERESREQKCLAALETLASRENERGNHSEAIRYLKQAQALNPLNETVARRLMDILVTAGASAEAIEIYRNLSRHLNEELAVVPDADTTRLFHEIRTRAREAPRETVRPSTPALSSSNSTERSTSRAPHPLAPIIGREQEINEILERLRQSRLVTLIGAGGVGKTRLAMEVAALAVQFEGGVVWVELAPLTEGALILPAIAEALDISQEGMTEMETLKNRLVTHFAEYPSLLIVDNCEHLVDNAAEILQTLLSRCPSLTALVTSRQRLGVTGETVYSVPSLSVPNTELLPVDPAAAREMTLNFPAIRLFVERTVSGQAGFQRMRRSEIEAVCRICRRLDGIPLALELAAARTNALSVEQIAVRLDDRFRLLTGGSRVDAPRHRTLRALIDWSYELLSESERILLRRLSIFTGGWDLEAAEYMGIGELFSASGTETFSNLEPSDDVLDILASLVDKSLVLIEEQPERLRYRMLETVREYGQKKLEENGEQEMARTRYSDYYLALAEQAKLSLGNPNLMWLNRLEIEHDNLRTALAYFAAQDETVEKAARMALALAPLWDLRGHFYEQRLWLAGLVRRPNLSKRIQAELLGWAAQLLAFDQGFLASKLMFIEMLEIMRSLNDQTGISNALNGLGWLMSEPSISGSEYDPSMARVYLDESLTIMREQGNRQGMAHSLFRLGCIARQTDDYDAARLYWMECCSLDKEIGVKGGLALRYLGEVTLECKDYEMSRCYFEEFLSARYEIGERWGVAWGLRGLGAVALAQGKPIRAARLQGASLALLESFALSISEAHPAYKILKNTLREVLDESAFERAWTEGKTMTLEQAVEYALQGEEKTEDIN